MIAQHEVFIQSHSGRMHFTLVAIFLGHIILFQGLAVDDHAALAHFHAIAGHSDYTLDVGLAGIAGEPEHHRVAPIDFFEVKAVDELVDEDPFLVVRVGIMLVPSTFTGW